MCWNGEEGLDMAINRRPRMVVLDAQLSDVDGEKSVMALRARAMPQSAPIVLLAHYSASSERARFIWAVSNERLHHQATERG